MTMARKLLVDAEVTRFYHCVSRCVRRAFLCGKGFEHRKQWIEDRLQVLSDSFAISVAGFAVLDNHLHLLIRLDPLEAQTWSPEQLVRRWISVFRPSQLDFENAKAVDAWVAAEAQNPKKIESYRERLSNLGWFMKALKEPLARMANKEDDCKGAFWEGRYKSVAILDEEALLAISTYIDLNPFAAGASALPETSKHTSLRQRVVHVKRKGKLQTLKAAQQGSIAGSKASGNLEQDHWLIPIEDRRPYSGDSVREGMLESFSLGSYLQLVDYTSRLYRSGKARLSAKVAGIFERLGTSSEYWMARMKKLLRSDSLHGNYFAGDRQRLRELADHRGHHHIVNLSPQPSG